MSDRSWLSAHVHVSCAIQSSQFENVLMSAVAPFVRACVANRILDRYFIVRFMEGGPHLRVRLLARDSAEAAELKRELEEWVVRWSAGELARERLDVRWVPYEPETQRYGGTEGLRVCEEFFH